MALTGLPAIVSSCISPEDKKKILLKSNDIILFQGDSLTEGFRKYEFGHVPNIPQALGEGFVRVCAGALLSEYCDRNLKIYNHFLWIIYLKMSIYIMSIMHLSSDLPKHIARLRRFAINVHWKKKG